MEATIYEKATKAIEAFLDRKGYDIIERGWAHGSDRADFIAREDGDLVFITVKIAEGAGLGFPEENPAERAKASNASPPPTLSILARATSPVRFDIVSMMVLGESRAFLRLHRNALSAL
jgi:putative endonuclease